MAGMKTVSLVDHAIRKVRIDSQSNLEVALHLFRDDLLGLIARIERLEAVVERLEKQGGVPTP